MAKRKAPSPDLDDLIVQEVGPWSEDKYALHWLYSTLFSSGMRNKWESRVYVDLYAGCGVSRIKGTNRLAYGSPLLAMLVDHPFDKYVLCEANSEKLTALEKRANRIAPGANASFILGDCDQKIDEICSAIPRASRGSRVLTFCFVDPYDLGIRFRTIERLAEGFTDFLVLLALQMDANRNYDNYLAPGSTKVAELLDDQNWRSRWSAAQLSGKSFPRFLADEFARKMESLNYLPPPPMKDIRDNKNLLLYQLAIFSRHNRAYEFWDDVVRYHSNQRWLF